MSDTTLTFLFGALMVLGLFGSLVPMIPDVSLQWLAALGYGLLVGWGPWGFWVFVGISVLALAGAVSEVWLGSAGARAGGASFWSIAAGFSLGVIGFVFFTPIGGLVGLLLGTFLAEYWRVRDSKQAVKGTLGMGVGYGLSFLVKGALGIMIFVAWLVWVIAL